MVTVTFKGTHYVATWEGVELVWPRTTKLRMISSYYKDAGLVVRLVP